MTAREIAEAVRTKQRSAREVVDEHLARIDEREAELHAFNLVLADEARGGRERDRRTRRRRRRSRSAGRRAHRAEGQHVHARHPDHVLVAHPRRLAAAVRRHRRRAVARRRRDRDRQDQPRRVRDGLVDGELGVRPHAQPARHEARARRFERRQRGRGRGRVQPARLRLRHRRLDPPARGVVRRRRPEADVRPGVALRPRRVRVEPRPDRPVHHDRRRRRRSRSRSSPATTRSTRHRSPSRSRRTATCCATASKACASASSPSSSRPTVSRSMSCAESRRRPPRSSAPAPRSTRRRCRRRSTACRRTTSSLRGGVEQPRPLRRRALRPARRRADHGRDEHEDAHRGLRRRGEAPHHARHVRALGGLLRRVLRQGAARAHAHPARLRAGLRELRRADRPNRAVHRVRVRRQGRSVGDVPQRRVHDPVQPQRPSGDVGAVRRGRRRSADRRAGARSGARREAVMLRTAAALEAAAPR